jgi:hypothetical protein
MGGPVWFNCVLRVKGAARAVAVAGYVKDRRALRFMGAIGAM